MRSVHWAFALLPALGTLPASAQKSLGASEHYYLFRTGGELSPYTEKVLTEAITGFDPGMTVSIDPPAHRMKLRTTRILDPQEVVALAAQYGVTLTGDRPDPRPSDEPAGR